MSTFYVLPPRPLLADRLASYLSSLFPGLDWSASTGAELLDVLGVAAAKHPGVYVVHCEDLPDGEDVASALADGFGAEPGDQVIEVRPGWPGELKPPLYSYKGSSIRQDEQD